MQFLLTAYDDTDADALKRRMDSRPEHLSNIAGLKRKGEFLFGGAILDEDGKMIGSMIVYECADRKTLDERLRDEPYISCGVWKSVSIVPFRLANIQ